MCCKIVPILNFDYGFDRATTGTIRKILFPQTNLSFCSSGRFLDISHLDDTMTIAAGLTNSFHLLFVSFRCPVGQQNMLSMTPHFVN